MKIISKPDTNWNTRHTCLHCEAVLEVDKSDIKSTYYDGDIRDPGYFKYTADCPICHVSFEILRSLLPKAVQLEIQNKGSK